MKKLLFFILINLIVFCASAQDKSPEGAWLLQDKDITQTAVFTDGYLSHSVYDFKHKKFISTRGGTYTTDNNKLVIIWQYDSEKAASNMPVDTWVGKAASFTIEVANNKLKTNLSGSERQWNKIDNNDAPLAGVWYITGRKQGNEMAKMKLGDRRTLKILSGTRFQWVAINIKTGEFSGTGGGTYSFKIGKYTENIEFFSRNNDRVGASLSFDAKIENGNWHHSGKSSSGDPIYEIWSRINE